MQLSQFNFESAIDSPITSLHGTNKKRRRIVVVAFSPMPESGKN